MYVGNITYSYNTGLINFPRVGKVGGEKGLELRFTVEILLSCFVNFCMLSIYLYLEKHNGEIFSDKTAKFCECESEMKNKNISWNS